MGASGEGGHSSLLVPRCLGWAVTASRWQLQVELPGKQVHHRFEVSHRTIAACLGLGGLHQAVDALNQPVGDLAVEPAQTPIGGLSALDKQGDMLLPTPNSEE